MTTIPVDVDGLNLLLGGGVPVIKRAQDLEASASILVRGPPGSGKTILGLQLAGSIARYLRADVAYGCVEILPSEIAAQHRSLGREAIREQVLTAPFSAASVTPDGCRIFAGILDIGSSGEETSRIDAAIVGLLEEVGRCGGRPRVVVIDSLSDGYRLGASAPRELADAMCKMAASRGAILILLEEIASSGPTVWSFAVDIAIQLSVGEGEPSPGAPGTLERRLAVTKNRFGPSQIGVNHFAILSGEGVRVFPTSRAYLSQWAPNVVLPQWENRVLPPPSWTVLDIPEDWALFHECVTTVYGAEPEIIYRLASRIGSKQLDNQPCRGVDVILDFSIADVNAAPTTPSPAIIVRCGNQFSSGDRLLADAVRALESARLNNEPVRRVVIGDFQAIQTFWSADAIRRAISVFIAVLRRTKIPAILYETVSANPSAPVTAAGAAHGRFDKPPSAHLADVLFELHPTYLAKKPLHIIHPRRGLLISTSVHMTADGVLNIEQANKGTKLVK